MTLAQIHLPPSIRTIVDVSIDAVWCGRRAIVNEHGTPHTLRGSNARAFADLSWALVRVRRLAKIVRYVFVIAAAWMDMKLPKARAKTLDREPSGLHSGAEKEASPKARGPGGAGPPPPRFPLSTPVHYLRYYDDEARQPVPAAFAHAVRDPRRTLARHIEALTRVLLDPMPCVRRLARWLRRNVCYVRRVWAKRPPPIGRRGSVSV